MSSRLKFILLGIVFVFVSILSSFLSIRTYRYFHPDPLPIVYKDTIVDTVTIEHTKVDSIVYRDTILQVLRQTDTVLETVFVPYEYKTYEDSISNDSVYIFWKAKYSGFDASIDSFSMIYSFKGKKLPERTQKRLVHYNAVVGTSIMPFNTQRLSFGLDFGDRVYIGVTGIRYNNNFSYTADIGVRW